MLHISDNNWSYWLETTMKLQLLLTGLKSQKEMERE